MGARWWMGSKGGVDTIARCSYSIFSTVGSFLVVRVSNRPGDGYGGPGGGFGGGSFITRRCGSRDKTTEKHNKTGWLIWSFKGLLTCF